MNEKVISDVENVNGESAPETGNAEGLPEVEKTGDDILANLLSGYAQPMTVANDERQSDAEATADNSPTGTLNKDGTERKKRGRKPIPDMELGGELISGSMFLFFVDLVVPFAIASLNNWKSKTKIDGDKLSIPKEQMKQLIPLAEAVVKQLRISGNPVLLLIFGLVTIYGIQFAAVKALAKTGEGNILTPG